VNRGLMVPLDIERCSCGRTDGADHIHYAMWRTDGGWAVGRTDLWVVRGRWLAAGGSQFTRYFQDETKARAYFERSAAAVGQVLP
jgi:hypothetical protein